MWLGDERVRTLETYLLGYAAAREDLGAPRYGEGERDLLAGFASWLQARFDKTETFGWSGVIVSLDDGDKNIYVFFELFEQYLGTLGRSLDDPSTTIWPAVY